MASGFSNSTGGPGGYTQQPFPSFSSAPKPQGNVLGGPGGYAQQPGISAQMTPQQPPMQMPPPFGMSPMQFGNAPGNVRGPNPPMSIPGMYGAQQALVGTGMYSGQQPSQMSPDFLKALSMTGLTPPAPAAGQPPVGGMAPGGSGGLGGFFGGGQGALGAIGSQGLGNLYGSAFGQGGFNPSTGLPDWSRGSMFNQGGMNRFGSRR